LQARVEDAMILKERYYFETKMKMSVHDWKPIGLEAIGIVEPPTRVK